MHHTLRGNMGSRHLINTAAAKTRIGSNVQLDILVRGTTTRFGGLSVSVCAIGSPVRSSYLRGGWVSTFDGQEGL